VLPIGIEGMTLPAGTQALVTKALAAATAPRGGGGGGGRGGGQPAAGRGGQAGESRAGGAQPQTAGEGARQGGGGQPAAQGEGQRGRGQAAGGRRGGGGGGQPRPWVRGMLTRQKGRAALAINGQRVFENVPVKSASPRGRVVLHHQDRPIEFASIFVKTLD
jgi:hypothetical protein